MIARIGFGNYILFYPRFRFTPAILNKPKLLAISMKILRLKKTPIAGCLIASVLIVVTACSSFAAQPSAKELVAQYKEEDKEVLRQARALYEQSQATLDERLDWWEEARFGMFVHYGVYAELAGYWRGGVVRGYAEQIMRSQKITKAEYLEHAVKKFNPVKFDADEWIRLCKATGMKYFVITAKHHDGFAMWHSENPYNIVDQTPFGRDIMQELRAACKRHGIRFGVYYSHAQEWHHEGGQRNTQDYPNHPTTPGKWPGMEKYIPHLVKTREYVDEKAIPQLEEIINDLQPEIIWFDTGFWLPAWELNRIYVRARELDPEVVISGRVGRGFGDYRTTADKPYDFPPVEERYWEAIPTTNESYGYHRLDNAYKPASHFIGILAKCVAQGGNLLMNVGPKGDGTISEKDQEILHGVGEWMEVNSAAIYGCGQASLPMQSWGYVTQGIQEYNKDELYLLIDQWPKDGKLIVHGLKSLPKTATALAEEDFKLVAAAHGGHAIVIDLPEAPLDPTMSVIRLKFSGTPATEEGPQRLLANVGANEIHVFYSDDRSKTISNGNGSHDSNTVFGWHEASQFMSWDVYNGEPARYRVEVEHYVKNPSFRNSRQTKINETPVGEDLVLSIGDVVIQGTHVGEMSESDEPEMDGSHADGDSKGVGLLTSVLGEVALPVGEHRLTLRVDDFPEGTGFFPKTIRLVPDP